MYFQSFKGLNALFQGWKEGKDTDCDASNTALLVVAEAKGCAASLMYANTYPSSTVVRIEVGAYSNAKPWIRKRSKDEAMLSNVLLKLLLLVGDNT